MTLSYSLSNQAANSSDEFNSVTYHFKELSIEKGQLLDNEINDIIQDHAGFIWLATGQGLSKYDGYNFDNYFQNINEPNSISSNIIRVIFEDSKKRLWVGTEHGLNQLNTHQKSFKHYFHNPNVSNTLADNIIIDIDEDNKGNLWIATETAVHLYSEQNANFNRYHFYDTSAALNATINFIQPYDDSLIVGTSTGLYRYNQTTDSFYHYSYVDGLPDEVRNYRSAAISDNNNIWISIDGAGIYYKDNQASQFEPIKNINGSSLVEPSNDVFYQIYFFNNYLWLSSSTQGLLNYNLQTEHLQYINQARKTQSSDFKYATIKTFYKDRSNLLWIGTEIAGISIWSQDTLNITHYGAFSDLSEEYFYSAYIWNFHETADDKLWVGTRKGLKQFDLQSKQLLTVDLNLPTGTEEPQIYWIDSNNNSIWLATEDKMMEYQQGRGVIRTISRNSDSQPQIKVDGAIYAVATSDQTLFYAINEVGVFAIDLDTLSEKQLSISEHGTNAHLVKRPVAIVKDKDQSLWILTREGLVNYDPKSDQVLLHLTASVDGLSGKRVSALFQENDNTYWIGTAGNGFNRLVIEDKVKNKYSIEQFNNKKAISNLIINGLLVDENESKNIWISSHSGLYVYNIESGYLRKFDDSEGIQSREFNEGAYVKDHIGYLYFGGVNGFNRIDPTKFNRSIYQPPLRITNFKLTCQSKFDDCVELELRFKQYLNCLNSDLEQCTKSNIVLPYDIESLSFEFASLDYSKPLSNLYRYRFKKNDDTPWLDLNNTHEILFTRLNSGKYNLEIQGSNYTGQWSPLTTNLKFTVSKPWYLETYSILALLILIITSSYFYRKSKRFKYLEHKRVEAAIKRNEENFKFALWGSGDELWEWHVPTDELIRTNPIKQIDVGNLEVEQTLSNTLSILHPDDMGRVRNEILEHIKGKSPYFESIFRLKSKGSGYLWLLARARVVERDETDRAIRLLGSIKDITLMKATEDKLTLIAQAFENTKDGISVLDNNFNSIFNNKAFYEITGLSHLKAMSSQYFFSTESKNHDMFNQVKVALRNFGEWEGEIWEQRPNGEEFAIAIKLDIVQEGTENDTHFICVFSDITYRKKSEEELIKLANIDSLTGLPNRSLLMDRLSHAVAFSKRHETEFALMFIDLDNFKNINDTLGHSVGDEILVKVAERLKNCVRNVDTVARLGGDEFTVILENVKSTNEVGLIANKILKRLSKLIEVQGTLLKTTPSIGIGMFPSHGDNVDSLLKNADLAMYSAKEKGKNNYQFFTEDMTSSAMERINIENKLREAIELDQLELYYQPKVYSVTGELTGFEALIRWIHPEDGMISPGAFIPIAEETGLILSMGDWILEEAIKQAKSWSKINPDCCAIAVNLSAKQFLSENLPEQIESMLKRHDLEPRYIELEITEGTLMENMQHTISALQRLRDMGLAISLDDFGTGYSSLSYLKQFPVNKLKIDQSFVQDITTDPSDASIVASIINLAHNLGLNVVAEGCETKEQLQFIRSYHCEEVQGYLFSRPLPKAEAEQVLRIGEIKIESD